MRYSKLFGKTIKEAPRDEVAVNAKLLLRGGFIDKLMTGSYTLLHLGRRVEQKIEQIVKEEMNATGAGEILMPLMHPKEIWNETGRWDSAEEVMYQFNKDEKEYALSFTHEEIVMDLIRKHVTSYKDFPVKIYHFSTKFRNEKRAKSGILRGREFLMKDLYSAHVSEKDMMEYYDEVKQAYKRIFKRMGLDAILTQANGGVFTKNFTHEFQVIADSGEDEIIYCSKGDFCVNSEVSSAKEKKQCDLCGSPLKRARAIEVGNIFPLGTYYSEKMGVNFMDRDGSKKPVWFASYGIGLTRAVGAIVEVHNDEKGIIWPENVAPYKVQLIAIGDKSVKDWGDEIYQKLKQENIDVLYDDREDVSPGTKFADADLIGNPVRLVVSSRTAGKIEFKKRTEEKSELMDFKEAVKRLT